jgi:hypothetical protein
MSGLVPAPALMEYNRPNCITHYVIMSINLKDLVTIVVTAVGCHLLLSLDEGHIQICSTFALTFASQKNGSSAHDNSWLLLDRVS